MAARHMKRNSSLVTMARTGVPDFSGLVIKPGNLSGPVVQHSHASQPPLIVQGSRTTVQLGGGMSPPSPGSMGGGHQAPPGVDIDRVAAAMQTTSSHSHDRDTAPLSQVAAHQGRQLGRSLAGVLSGAAANLKSKIVGGIHVGGGGGGRITGGASPSPPRRKEETDSLGSFESRSITAPGNLNSQDLGYPVRLKSRPQGPRETPPSFVKKQEYL